METFGSPEAFWNAYRGDDGARLHWQGILNMLKIRREKADDTDACTAKAFFGGDLDHPDAKGVFRYMKCGQSVLIAKDSAIAEKWRHLLATDGAIRQRFHQAHL